MFIQKFTVCIFVFLLIAGCLGNKANQAPSPSVNKNIVGSCGAGLDNSVSLGLSAQLESRGGKADAGFQDNLRAAIIDLVKELEIPPADRATTIQNIFYYLFELSWIIFILASNCLSNCLLFS